MSSRKNTQLDTITLDSRTRKSSRGDGNSSPRLAASTPVSPAERDKDGHSKYEQKDDTDAGTACRAVGWILRGGGGGGRSYLKKTLRSVLGLSRRLGVLLTESSLLRTTNGAPSPRRPGRVGVGIGAGISLDGGGIGLGTDMFVLRVGLMSAFPGELTIADYLRWGNRGQRVWLCRARCVPASGFDARRGSGQRVS